MELLHGGYDGGGVLAIAMRGERIASAGRDGGVRLWRIVGEELVRTKYLNTSAIASALLLPGSEDGPLWAGFLDGSLRRWSSLSGEEPALTVSCRSPVLAIASCAELGVIAAATVNGTVELYAMHDGTPRGVWSPFTLDDSKEFAGARARSVAFVQDAPTGTWSIFVGGSDGSMARHQLVGSEADVATDGGSISLFDRSRAGEKAAPNHGGQVVALTPGPAGVLVSGAHDGTIRVWDVSSGAPSCLYGLQGYKVWLGSVCSDGARLISDGADNANNARLFGRGDVKWRLRRINGENDE